MGCHLAFSRDSGGGTNYKGYIGVSLVHGEIRNGGGTQSAFSCLGMGLWETNELILNIYIRI